MLQKEIIKIKCKVIVQFHQIYDSKKLHQLQISHSQLYTGEGRASCEDPLLVRMVFIGRRITLEIFIKVTKEPLLMLLNRAHEFYFYEYLFFRFLDN